MAEPQISFQCPNGHQLNGPPTLLGQLGQCPRCGVKFRIPNDAGSGMKRATALTPDEELLLGRLTPIAPAGSTCSSYARETEMHGDAEVHPAEQLLATLWREREHGGVIEIHVENFVLVPDWWAESLSTDSHAVFALQTADGSYVIEAVTWDSIRRITVRRIRELPDGVFH